MFNQITTVEAAFEKHPDRIDLQKTIQALADLPPNVSRGMIALLTLQSVVFVVNNDDPAEPDFIADYNDDNQEKWSPWYVGGARSGSGFRFIGSDYGWTSADASGGARLALKDQKRADHMNEYFQELYKELYLILDK